MPEVFWTYMLLCATAFLAGVMNSIAGGGTLLTFPALAGIVTPAIANATSTVALLPGSLAGAAGYRSELKECRRFLLRMIVPSFIGGLLGAWLVIQDEQAFAMLVPWLILTAALLFAIQAPVMRWLKSNKPDREPGTAMISCLIAFQFLIALYGGYFGAGIGILMLTALGFMGVGDIHRMNALKTCLASIINAASVIIFVAYDRVNWSYALAMAIAAIFGGYLGARVARRLPAQYVRYAVIAIGFGLALYYFSRS